MIAFTLSYAWNKYIKKSKRFKKKEKLNKQYEIQCVYFGAEYFGWVCCTPWICVSNEIDSNIHKCIIYTKVGCSLQFSFRNIVAFFVHSFPHTNKNCKIVISFRQLIYFILHMLIFLYVHLWLQFPFFNFCCCF